ncbi:alanine racemase [Marivirga tractuosa]|uniref:Alanine racemase n=1 Tax=Marivirga tractuosa (strain ATCC 23168 / DSM 4126 / NBRC 15989 / NCIMB 1408 / VKM B-1430 / H-43) TaxID=643867 RepID=E4TW12_MARTH|nr:alanine racemase [Marivirga tractuosa]ADR23230.1 alanine racemase [Marivirga tractuosa DSM 4126]BDD16096.1 alanine racemase [Marivirga tractuosa]
MNQSIFSTSTITLSKSAVRQNVRFVRKRLAENVLLSAVLKGNAYGHGIKGMVPLFESANVKHLSVFSTHEAEQVCQVKKKTTEVMIMGWMEDEETEWAIENEVEFYVFEMGRLKAALHYAKTLNKIAKIHVEVETGMNRTGFEEEHLEELMQMMKENHEYISFVGLCTHYAGAESITNYLRVVDQIKKYKKIYDLFVENDLVPKRRHTACSAAAMSYPETQMDMVRIGILLYGFWPSQETFIAYQRSNGHGQDGLDRKVRHPLKRVISWRSKIMSVKEVPVGEFIGYGTSYQATKKMKIATVPVGYAYGFARSLSNQGRVIVNGKRVAVISTVNMNLMIINVTECKNVGKGDEVIMIGSNGKVNVTVASFGELSNQLNYELLSRLPMDIPRRVVI